MPTETTAVQPSQVRRFMQLPREVWLLSWVSLCMDISSELVHSLLPVFLTTVLGASMVTVGVIEGIAEATAAFTKVFSGVLSDYLRKRKLLVLLGYGLSAFTKPVFPLATSVGWIFAARFIDRIGKGIRGAPRDALIADVVPQNLRGTAYGFRQAFDSVGALLGPLLAVVFMYLLAGNITGVLWVAVLPGMLAVFLISRVREPADIKQSKAKTLHWRNGEQLPARYWLVVGLGAVFTLARFSEAFLILRAQDVGLAIGYVPLIMIVMNLVYAAMAFPAGAAADRFSARMLLALGMLALIMADGMLAIAATPGMTLAGAAVWGLHMALTQGLLSKLIADAAPAELRGTAFGIFNLVTGLALLLASVMAGLLWSRFGAASTFWTGGALALIAMLGVLLIRPQASRN